MYLLGDSSRAEFAAAGKVGMKIAEGIKQTLKKSRAIDKNIGKKVSKSNPFLMGESAAKALKRSGGKLKNAKTPAQGGMKAGGLADGLTMASMRRSAGLKK